MVRAICGVHVRYRKRDGNFEDRTMVRAICGVHVRYRKRYGNFEYIYLW